MHDPARPSRGHMDRHPQNDWGSVNYDARFDVYWVEAGEAKQQLFYCPWCGEKLPDQQRDRWFDELEARGIAPEDGVPAPYDTGAWRGAIEVPPPPRTGEAIEGRYIDLFEGGGFDDAAQTMQGPPGFDPLTIAYAERPTALAFVSAAIGALTVEARAAYGEPDAEARLTRINEAIHRLSGQARDLADPGEPLTMSRVNVIAEQLSVLPPPEFVRLLSTAPLD